MMKRIFGVLMLAVFSAAIVGCEANAKVGDPDNNNMHSNNGSSYEKKTTVTRQPDGDTSTRTEVHTNR